MKRVLNFTESNCESIRENDYVLFYKASGHTTILQGYSQDEAIDYIKSVCEAAGLTWDCSEGEDLGSYPSVTKDGENVDDLIYG